MRCRRAPQVCSDCGDISYNIRQHKGSKACTARCKANELRAQGFECMLDLPRRFRKHAAPRALEHLVRRYLTHPNAQQRWLPKWACAMLLYGNWSEEIVQRVEGDPDTQVALALEYDLRKR